MTTKQAAQTIGQMAAIARLHAHADSSIGRPLPLRFSVALRWYNMGMDPSTTWADAKVITEPY